MENGFQLMSLHPERRIDVIGNLVTPRYSQNSNCPVIPAILIFRIALNRKCATDMRCPLSGHGNGIELRELETQFLAPVKELPGCLGICSPCVPVTNLGGEEFQKPVGGLFTGAYD